MKPGRIDRQEFLRLMGASLGLAGLTACGAMPAKGIAPYVRQPEEIVPGKSLYYASATTLGGYGQGILVKTTMGRPIKIEGNLDHPASFGATDVFGQASVLTLYDPDRSQTILNAGQTRAWEDFLDALTGRVDALAESRGAGLHLLTETVTSPSLADQIQTLLKRLPAADWYQFDPVGSDNVRAGALAAFGTYVDAIYHFDRADVVLALDADFLGAFPGHLRYAHDFADIRRLATGRISQSRLYVVESAPSITGAVADHRWPIRASAIPAVADAVSQALALPGANTTTQLPSGVDESALAAIVQDLRQHRGSSLIVVGPAQPAAVHVLGHRLNQLLGNVGTAVEYIDPVEANPVDQLASLKALTQAIASGTVDTLLVLGTNPVYTAPVDLDFAGALSRVPFSVHLGLYADETAALTTWHVPMAHELEAWGDVRAFDGTASIVQPTIEPLYGGKTAGELLAIVNGQGEPTSLEVVRGYWSRQHPGPDFDQFWRKSLNDGVVADTASPSRSVRLVATSATPTSIAPPTSPLEIVFRPDPTLYDGRYANNGWLQELPKPLLQLTWDNVALFSLATAQRLGLRDQDLVELRYLGRSLRAPVWTTPGHPDDSATVYLGGGRSRAGSVGNGVGYNAYLLRTSDAPWSSAGLEVHPTGEQQLLAQSQVEGVMVGRPIVLNGTLAEYQANPRFAQGPAGAPDGSLYPPYSYPDHAWGMAIDLSTCIGCKACEIACQAENNIPVVGKDQVSRGRIMHWIRIDRYDQGSAANPTTLFQPVPCMQCENAPCELVCPVGATVHSDEGLNDMVYNRCVGTRYCSNNCPYKVRRFNFFQYADWTTPTLKLLNNPDVSVRERGVMEKCTYCVQRINAARIQSKLTGQPIRDGDVVTACQAACPTQAIVFGDINDRNSQVARLKQSPLNYILLGDLNTRPRTTYLAAVRNPNPGLEA